MLEWLSSRDIVSYTQEGYVNLGMCDIGQRHHKNLMMCHGTDGDKYYLNLLDKDYSKEEP